MKCQYFLSLIFPFLCSCSLFSYNAGKIAYKFNLDYAENRIDNASIYENKFKDSDFIKDNLKKYSDEQIDYLLDTLSFFSSDKSLEWTEKVLAEKSLREKQSNTPRPYEWYAENLQRDYLRKGKLEKAFELQAKYPELSLSKLPERVITEKSAGNVGWRIYDIAEDGSTVILKDSQLAKGKHIVMYVSWGCEFADMAIEAIMTNPELRQAFIEKGVVIGNYLDIKEHQAWKKELGLKNVYSKYSADEIAPLASKDSPTFLFMSDGKVKYEFDSVFPNEESMGLLTRFRNGLKALSEDDKDSELKTQEISKQAQSAPIKRDKRKSPFFVEYSDYLRLAMDFKVLQFLNKIIISSNCVYSTSLAAIAETNKIADLGRVNNDIEFCPGKTGKPDKTKTFKMFDILKDVSSAHKIEFARSIITKDGHIISAYIEGIEKDLGKAKAKKIAAKLAGQEPQYGTVCEISENAETGEKTIKAASKKGYFCLAE